MDEMLSLLALAKAGKGGNGGKWEKLSEFTYNLNRELIIDSYTASSNQIHFTTEHNLSNNDYLLLDRSLPLSTKHTNMGYLKVTEIIDTYTVVCEGLDQTTDMVSLSVKVEVPSNRTLFNYDGMITKRYARLRINGCICYLDNQNQWSFAKYWSHGSGSQALTSENANSYTYVNSIVWIKDYIGCLNLGRRFNKNSSGYTNWASVTQFYILNINDWEQTPDKFIVLPKLVFNGLKIVLEESDEFEL